MCKLGNCLYSCNCIYIPFNFDDADTLVGYETTLYTTSEAIGQVEICVVLMSPGPATAPGDFVLSSTTESGTTSTYVKLRSLHANLSVHLVPMNFEVCITAYVVNT